MVRVKQENKYRERQMVKKEKWRFFFGPPSLPQLRLACLLRFIWCRASWFSLWNPSVRCKRSVCRLSPVPPFLKSSGINSCECFSICRFNNTRGMELPSNCSHQLSKASRVGCSSLQRHSACAKLAGEISKQWLFSNKSLWHSRVYKTVKTKAVYTGMSLGPNHNQFPEAILVLVVATCLARGLGCRDIKMWNPLFSWAERIDCKISPEMFPPHPQYQGQAWKWKGPFLQCLSRSGMQIPLSNYILTDPTVYLQSPLSLSFFVCSLNAVEWATLPLPYSFV